MWKSDETLIADKKLDRNLHDNGSSRHNLITLDIIERQHGDTTWMHCIAMLLLHNEWSLKLDGTNKKYIK